MKDLQQCYLFIYLFFCVVLLTHLLNKEPQKTENHLN